MSNDNRQNSLWKGFGDKTQIAELCNVLYERELKRLSQDQKLAKDALQKTLGSLSYYIQTAGHHILTFDSPLELDASNASWLAKQSAAPFSEKANTEQTSSFYQKHARIALTVPVVINVFGIEQVVLDTIDEVDEQNQRLHCNQQGWFYFGGHPNQQESENTDLDVRLESANSVTSASTTKLLLKPSKATMTAACCGHQWKNQHRMASRALSLRELLLATRVNWKKLSQPLPIKRIS